MTKSAINVGTVLVVTGDRAIPLAVEGLRRDWSVESFLSETLQRGNSIPPELFLQSLVVPAFGQRVIDFILGQPAEILCKITGMLLVCSVPPEVAGSESYSGDAVLMSETQCSPSDAVSLRRRLPGLRIASVVRHDDILGQLHALLARCSTASSYSKHVPLLSWR